MINVTLDENNLDNSIVAQEELDIMLECDEYNDFNFYKDLSMYESIKEEE